MISLRIDNRVRIAARELGEDVLSDLKRAFTHANAKHAMHERMGLPTWSEPREIKTWSKEGADYTFPRGGLAVVRDVIAGADLDQREEDLREDQPCPEMPDVQFTLRPYQEHGVRVILEREQALVRAPTGCGKSALVIAAIARAKQWTLVVCPTVKLLEQWRAELEAKLGIPERDVGIVRGGKARIRPVTLGIWKSVQQRAADPAFCRTFGFVCMDEVHLAGSKSFFAAIDPMPARYRVGVSNDHRRKDRKEFLVTDLFGPPAVQIDRRDLVDAGHILDVEVRVIPTEFEAPWYGMPREGVPDEDQQHIDVARLHREMHADADRNWLAVGALRQESSAGKQAIVLAHEREHCHTLAQMVQGQGARVGYLIGGDDYSEEFDRTLHGLRSGAVSVGVGTYKAMGTGIDIPQVAVGVAVTPIGSNEQAFGQVSGRLCRTSTGKSGARLYVLWDRKVFPTHLANMRRWNPNTAVLHEGAWVPARQYLKGERAKARRI